MQPVCYAGNNPTNVCERCAGQTLETRCTCNDPFGGFAGAFECMASGTGDVAFVRNSTVQEYVKLPNTTLTEQVRFCWFSTVIFSLSIRTIVSQILAPCSDSHHVTTHAL